MSWLKIIGSILIAVITLFLKYMASGSKRAKSKYLALREGYAERRHKRIARVAMRKSVDNLVCKTKNSNKN